MTSRRLLVPALLTLTLAASAIAGGWNTPPSVPNTVTPQPIVPVGTSGEYTVLDVGSSAPDFSYESPAGDWHRLHDLRSQGHVLLVFGASDARLTQIEQQRAQLLRMGIVPVAVLDRRAGVCRRTVERLNLGFLVVSDAQHVIAAQFHALEASSRGLVPAWFVLDQKGRVRALARQEWPARNWTEVAGNALGLPLPESSAPASHR